MARQLRTYDSTVMLFGFHPYTSTWAALAKAPSGVLNSWVHSASKTLITAEEVLIQFPNLKVIVIDVLNELLHEVVPLSLPASAQMVTADFYSSVEKMFVISPDIKVRNFIVFKAWSEKRRLFVLLYLLML